LQELTTGSASPLCSIQGASRVLLTKPRHVHDQPYYSNQVVVAWSYLGPRRLLEAIHRVEERGGRDRSREFRFGPRSLDIDLLLYDDLVISSQVLQIPHPRMHRRVFVLEPLVSIASDSVDPRSGRRWALYLDFLRRTPPQDEAGYTAVGSGPCRAVNVY
jgi:2-amino-4-hydroxy-6-hydroxymethyldihydropteridine diphosphokinase